MTTNVGNAQSFGINVGQTFSDQQLYGVMTQRGWPFVRDDQDSALGLFHKTRT